MAEDVPNAEGQACTIYLPVLSYERVWNVVRDSGLPFSIDGSISDWSVLTARDDESTLTLSSLKRATPGDKFSRLILGTFNFFNRIESAPSERRRLIKESVAKCQMMVGARGRPSFSDEHMDLIFAIAQTCDGLIFNGSGMIDGAGHLILNSDGSFDP